MKTVAGPSRSRLRASTWLDNLIAPRGSSVSNGPFSSPLAPRNRVTGVRLRHDAGRGGRPQSWKSPLGRFGPFVRLGVAGLYDFALPSAFEVYVSANAGLAVELE